MSNRRHQRDDSNSNEEVSMNNNKFANDMIKVHDLETSANLKKSLQIQTYHSFFINIIKD